MRLAIMSVLFAVACHANGVESDAPDTAMAAPRHAPLSEFRGMYSEGFEVSAFRPCGSAEKWWVGVPGPLHAEYEKLTTQRYVEIYVVVRGDTSGEGRVGHMGLYTRYMSVDSVVVARHKSDMTGADSAAAHC